MKHLVFLFLVACSNGWAPNPLACTVTDACYDCLKTTCKAQLQTAESACKDFIECKMSDCTDTRCALKGTASCQSANQSLVSCESNCSVCPGK